MPAEIPQNRPDQEKREVLDDNARKFIVGRLDESFLHEHEAASYRLIVDWLEMNEDHETKVAYKDFGKGNIQILLIAKTIIDGNRISEKKKITEKEYEQLKSSSIQYLEKMRYEFIYTQNGISFSMKYDEFVEGNLRILEVDALNEIEREAFNPNDFPIELEEVTGNTQYYGYRVAEVL